MKASSKNLICIVGPTASGKSRLAFSLPEKLKLKLISVDSMQVYRGMDIGTSKPSPKDRQKIELCDLVDPGEPFSAGKFCRGAVPLIEQCWLNNEIPTLVGGTGLYFEALLKGLAEIPTIDPSIRKTIEDLAKDKGTEYLAALLKEEDPLSAGEIDLRNPRRSARALEVWRATGKSIITWQKEGTNPAIVPEKTLWIGLNPSTEALEALIKKRIGDMLASGWENEAISMAQMYGKDALLATGAIGYADILKMEQGEQTKTQTIDTILIQTRQYAKRQRTWFKRRSEVNWLENNSSKTEQALTIINSFFELP